MPTLRGKSLVVLPILFSSFAFAEQPPEETKPADSNSHYEKAINRYVPGYPATIDGRNLGPVYPLVRPTRGGFESVQVNVNFAGQNILGDAANEPSIAMDPNNPDRMVIGWRQFDFVGSDFRQAGRAYSDDGGVTWTFPGVLERGEFASDPVVDSDSDGNFYYYSLQPNRGTLPWNCFIYKSTDGGETFGTGVQAYGGDKAWMVVDKSGGIGDGNIYVQWSPNQNANCCGPNLFTRSLDGGATFMPPIPVPLEPFAGTMSIAADGTLYIVGGADASGRVPIARSINARIPGATPSFNLATTAFIGGQTAFGGVNPAGLLGQMWVAVDNSDGPTAGAVYVCGSVRPVDASGDPLDIMFISSSNAGADWSTPVRVNDDPRFNGASQWFGTMSVAPNGRIDVVWNDTRADETGSNSETYYSFSINGGRTWARNQPITRPWSHFVGYPQQNKIGDYYHMISEDQYAHLAYSATFNGEQDVYYLRIIRLLTRCELSEADRGLDCNGNGVADDCDIERGNSQDEDNNFIPDECESDFDGDGVHDGEDFDIDNDGVPNDLDICDFTPRRVPVTPEGLSFGDLNRDCGTDLLDFGLFDNCVEVGGPGGIHPLRYCRLNFDGDGDEDCDLLDIARFQNAFTGFGD